MRRIPACLFLFSLLAAPTAAHAYIDPGTGGAVFGGLGWLLGLAAAGGAFLLRPVRRVFGRIFRRKKPGGDGE